MCGIVGFHVLKGDSGDLNGYLRPMTDTLRHRGPDDEGQWCDLDAGVGLGHRRLAIIDPSQRGHQPMTSAAGRYVIAYNGEIYNCLTLAHELQRLGVTFRGHSDTEVILAAIECWGLVSAVSRLAGMFAFAVWDRAERTLHLVRDRLGEKPLYHCQQNGALLFASELKALRANPRWASEVHRGALSLYLRHGYIPAPYSIYRDVVKVMPGTIVTFGSASSSHAPEVECYWSAREAVQAGLGAPLRGTTSEILDVFDTRLRETVDQEMISDVSLGAFLSGGIDSSLVVALMQAQSSRPVRTFTIGFHDKDRNEATHARAVARYLGTDHTEHYVTAADAMAVIPRIPELYDEPFADSSQIPTFLVAQLARRHVTVSLSGDGGDELFAGYDRYKRALQAWRMREWLPASARVAVGRTLRRLTAARRKRGHWPGCRLHKMHRIAMMLEAPTDQALYRELVSRWGYESSAVLGGVEPRNAFTNAGAQLESGTFLERMMYLDLTGYLPDDLMVKVDRASMAVSLESRAPFLDHRVVELAWRVPLAFKLRRRQGKWFLRRLLARYLPADLIQRPKKGFGIPLETWLRGPLREWAGDLLAPSRLRADGFLNPAVIKAVWDGHQSGRCDFSSFLWAVLVFQAWLDAARNRVCS